MSPSNKIPLLTVLFMVLICYTHSYGEISVVKKFKIPDFNSRASLNFTDICFDTQTQKLAVCSDGGYGEFPFKQGKVVFVPPGFISETGSYLIRGYFMADGTLNAVDIKNRIIFWGKKKLSFPMGLSGEITGVTYYNSEICISTSEGTLYRLSVTGSTLNLLGSERILGTGIEGMCVYDNEIWVTDGLTLFRIENGVLLPQGKFPVVIKGFCFMNTSIFAVTGGYRYILLMRLD